MLDTIQRLSNRVNKLRNITGCSLLEAHGSLKLFNYNVRQAQEFIRIRSQAVVRKTKDGEPWKTQDYVDYIKKNY